jgi:ribonuclease-3
MDSNRQKSSSYDQPPSSSACSASSSPSTGHGPVRLSPSARTGDRGSAAPNVEPPKTTTSGANYQWIRSSLIESFYRESCDGGGARQVIGTDRLQRLQGDFDQQLIQRAGRVRAAKEPFEFPPRKAPVRSIKHCLAGGHSSSHGSSDEDLSDLSDDSSADPAEEGTPTTESDHDSAYEELQKKRTHPWRLHDELWYNDAGEMNDGPLCRCSAKARKTGIRHGIYPGETPLSVCQPHADNRDRLHHYRLVIRPDTNFTTKFPTRIEYDRHEFAFEGFSLLSHRPLPINYPPCKLIRFNIEYEISIEPEKFPCNFTVNDLELFSRYLFGELLELEDLDWRAAGDSDGCPRFHVYPRFVRTLIDDGIEFLPMHALLTYLLQSASSLIREDELVKYKHMAENDWIQFATRHKGMIVTYPGMKPSSIRVDQLDRELDAITVKRQERARRKARRPDAERVETDDRSDDSGSESDSVGSAGTREHGPLPLDDDWPIIVHFGIRPPQLSYAGNPKYQKTWRDFVKYRHLLANKPKVTFDEKQLLLKKEEKLQEMRLKSDLKRDCTITISTKGFVRTGIFCDVIQYALVLPVMVCHLRFHESLKHLEEEVLSYNFSDRYLLQLALTHPSYRENFGTNADHARNSLTNCGIRQPYYGDRKVHFMNTRKRGESQY